MGTDTECQHGENMATQGLAKLGIQHAELWHHGSIIALHDVLWIDASQGTDMECQCGDNMANQCLGIQQLQSCDSDVAQHPCLMCSGLILLMGTDTECQRENMMATEPLP